MNKDRFYIAKAFAGETIFGIAVMITVNVVGSYIENRFELKEKFSNKMDNLEQKAKSRKNKEVSE